MNYYSFTGNMNGHYKTELVDGDVSRFDLLSLSDQTDFLRQVITSMAFSHEINVHLLVFEKHQDITKKNGDVKRGRMHAHAILYALQSSIDAFKEQYFMLQKYQKQNYKEHHELYIKCDVLATVPDYDRWMRYCLKDQSIINRYLLEARSDSHRVGD